MNVNVVQVLMDHNVVMVSPSNCRPMFFFKSVPYNTEGLNNHGSLDRGRTLFMDLRF